MPYKSTKQLDLSVEDEDVDSNDEEMTAEEAQMRAARLQKELDEQNKFDCLCDGRQQCYNVDFEDFSN